MRVLPPATTIYYTIHRQSYTYVRSHFRPEKKRRTEQNERERETISPTLLNSTNCMLCQQAIPRLSYKYNPSALHKQPKELIELANYCTETTAAITLCTHSLALVVAEKSIKIIIPSPAACNLLGQLCMLGPFKSTSDCVRYRPSFHQRILALRQLKKT